MVKRSTTGDHAGEKFDVIVILDYFVVEPINVVVFHTVILSENTYKIKTYKVVNNTNIKIECMRVKWSNQGGLK